MDVIFYNPICIKARHFKKTGLNTNNKQQNNPWCVFLLYSSWETGIAVFHDGCVWGH